jgi:DNA-directed RNA polymerase subunit RPC12/RpoP
MSDDEMILKMSMPLDSDGFLRRRCSSCERELKWLAAGDDEQGAEAPDGGFFCPYCGIQAPPAEWLTEAQEAHFNAMIQQEVLGPLLKNFGEGLQRSARGSGGLVSVEVTQPEFDEPVELMETDDMRRVDFACHPGESIKVIEDWSGPVRCVVCGTVADQPLPG